MLLIPGVPGESRFQFFSTDHLRNICEVDSCVNPDHVPNTPPAITRHSGWIGSNSGKIPPAPMRNPSDPSFGIIDDLLEFIDQFWNS